jgi:hypothetical protein
LNEHAIAFSGISEEGAESFNWKKSRLKEITIRKEQRKTKLKGG